MRSRSTALALVLAVCSVAVASDPARAAAPPPDAVVAAAPPSTAFERPTLASIDSLDVDSVAQLRVDTIVTQDTAMRLLDLSPRWMTLREGGDIVGISFRCPHCASGERGETTYLGVKFAQTIDRDGVDVDERAWPTYMLEHPSEHFWERSGDTFDTLTLSPSVDASAHGHWHGFIRGGEVT